MSKKVGIEATDTYMEAKEEREKSELLSVIEKTGGAEGDRTPDLMTASHALSRLSYSPTLWFFIVVKGLTSLLLGAYLLRGIFFTL